MADQQLTEANVRLCFEKIKDLINSLPQETFEEDTDLADKKKMADEALVPLEKFLNTFAEIQYDEIDDFTSNEKVQVMFAAACGRDAKIDIPTPV